MKAPTLICLSVLLSLPLFAAKPWIIDDQEDWEKSVTSSEGLRMEGGEVIPEAAEGSLTTVLHTFRKPKSANSLTLKQSPIWQNWNPIDNLGPVNLADAPVLLSLGPDNYWMFGRYGGRRNKKQQEQEAPFTPEAATLEGFDVPLQTTRWPNQFNAPGGLEPSLGGYHAWQSRDMVNWVHHGPVTEGFSRWVTSAEWKDGKAYIYYDYPNDQDPHVYVDSDLTDGKLGENKGRALADPSDGSDAGVIRDEEGNFHIIYEDWSPINANKRSWDSPLAGRAMSPNGLTDFKLMDPAVDNRTNPTGEMATYKHPHWMQHPDWDTNIATYEVHEPEQEAYGDWAAISVGGQYYLFGDYDPAGGHQMAVGWFTSSSLDEQFTWCDKIGNGHPDPDVCFAEGQFYLATQQQTDYTSPGPWVEKVEIRVGVDTNNDQKVDEWTDWQEIKESYDYTPGLSKQIAVTPAELDLSKLPEGYGFQIEARLTDTTGNVSVPILDSLTLTFQ